MNPTPRITRHVTDRRVLFFGDSLVAGVGDPSGLGWVGRVVAASFAASTPFTAYNLGVRGETSVQVASRWRAETRARLSPGADTRIVMSFGANDTTIEDGVQRVEAERSFGALSDILDRAQAIELPVLVVGPAPLDDTAPREQCRSSPSSTRSWGLSSEVSPNATDRLWMRRFCSGASAKINASEPPPLPGRIS
jgi:lysophospholipase L1-like esterase